MLIEVTVHVMGVKGIRMINPDHIITITPASNIKAKYRSQVCMVGENATILMVVETPKEIQNIVHNEEMTLHRSKLQEEIEIKGGR